MITPKRLHKGNKVGIVATARKIEMSEIKAAIKVFESWRLHVKLAKNLFQHDNQFAGTDEQRAVDLQTMLDDNEIKAIFCARGGYGTIKILEYLDFKHFLKNPKWIVGYSDITALHAHLNQNLGVKSIHGIMPLNFPKDAIENEAIKSLKKVLWGEKTNYQFPAYEFNKQGEIEGELIGGNLSVLYSISGTKFDIDTDGKILLIEDLDEYLYHIDRMMMNLKYGGKLKNLEGLIVGGMTDMNDNQIPFGKTAYEIIRDAIAEYNYPVYYNFPAGHIENNLALILGNRVKLNINNEKVDYESFLSTNS